MAISLIVVPLVSAMTRNQAAEQARVDTLFESCKDKVSEKA
jgi:hypothetical protein